MFQKLWPIHRLQIGNQLFKENTHSSWNPSPRPGLCKPPLTFGIRLQIVPLTSLVKKLIWILFYHTASQTALSQLKTSAVCTGSQLIIVIKHNLLQWKEILWIRRALCCRHQFLRRVLFSPVITWGTMLENELSYCGITNHWRPCPDCPGCMGNHSKDVL